jgi:hypothetical protein
MSVLLAGLMALTLSAAADEAPAGSVPAQSYGSCLPGVAPPGSICSVVGTASVGEVAGQPVTWSMYDVTGGAGRLAVSVLTTPDASGAQKVVATMPTTVDAMETWRDEPYVVASIIKRDGVDYVAQAMRGADGPTAFSVHRVDASGWTAIDSSQLWTTVPSKLTSLTRADCYVVAGDINWRSFGLRYDMMSDDGACGTAFLDLGVDQGAVRIVSAMAVKPDLTPQRHRRGRR